VRKLLSIAWKDITLRLADPIVLLVTFALPLTIVALVGLAFGDLALGSGVPDTSIRVGIVNQDQGSSSGNFGELFVHTMRPSSDVPSHYRDSLLRSFAVHELDEEPQARRMVEREDLIGVLVIPPGFSKALEAGDATVQLYINERLGIRGAAFKCAVEMLADRISTGRATVLATIEGLASHPRTREQLRSGELDEALADLALTAALSESNPIRVRRVHSVNQSPRIKLTHYLAASLAIMFASFTALIGSASLLQERTRWTLQRMCITPTRLAAILGGKALGSYLNGLIQMLTLIVASAAVEWISSTGPSQGPGIDPLGLSVLVLSIVAAATGVGLVIASVARTYAQAANYGRALLVVMGLSGGIFFPSQLFPQPFQALSHLTFHYWAMEGYLQLAVGGRLVDVVPHVLALTTMGGIAFYTGTRLVRHRIESSCL